MTFLFAANMAACAVIFVWATWCALSRRVRDGILGKIMFSLAALAALGVMLGPQDGYGGARSAEVALNIAVALLGLRHVTMKFIWPRLVRAARCKFCPKNEEN